MRNPLASVPEADSALRQIVVIRRALGAVAFCGALYAVFGLRPRGPIALLLITLPWIALHFVRKFTLSFGLNDVQPNALFACLLLPGSALTVRASYDASPIHWQAPAVLTLLGAAILAYGVARADADFKPCGRALLSCALIFGLYGYGATLVINGYLDFRSSEVHAARILDKRIERSRGRGRYFMVEPWGPVTSVDRVKVSDSLYDELNVGNMACLTWHRGALGVAWYAVSRCPQSP